MFVGWWCVDDVWQDGWHCATAAVEFTRVQNDTLSCSGPLGCACQCSYASCRDTDMHHGMQGRVVSGHRQLLAEVQALATAKGAMKVAPLSVSGAFHTPLMQPAQDKLKEVTTH